MHNARVVPLDTLSPPQDNVSANFEIVASFAKTGDMDVEIKAAESTHFLQERKHHFKAFSARGDFYYFTSDEVRNELPHDDAEFLCERADINVMYAYLVNQAQSSAAAGGAAAAMSAETAVSTCVEKPPATVQATPVNDKSESSHTTPPSDASGHGGASEEPAKLNTTAMAVSKIAFFDDGFWGQTFTGAIGTLETSFVRTEFGNSKVGKRFLDQVLGTPREYFRIPDGRARATPLLSVQPLMPRVPFVQRGETCLAKAGANATHLAGDAELALRINRLGVDLALGKFSQDKHKNNTIAPLSNYLYQNGWCAETCKVWYPDAATDSSRRKLRSFLLENSFDSPIIAEPRDDQGRENHVIVIFNGLVWDSNFDRALPLAPQTLDTCVDTNAEGRKCVAIARAVRLVRILPSKKKRKRRPEPPAPPC